MTFFTTTYHTVILERQFLLVHFTQYESTPGTSFLWVPIALAFLGAQRTSPQAEYIFMNVVCTVCIKLRHCAGHRQRAYLFCIFSQLYICIFDEVDYCLCN